MGCFKSTSNAQSRKQQFDNEEKVGKPRQKLTGDEQTPTIDSNALPSYTGEHEPLNASVTSTASTIPQPPYHSVLNNFHNNANIGGDANQYNDYTTNLTVDRDRHHSHRIAANSMLDSHGNVHVNKYYNVTRNHNLSDASKLTDLSEMPAPFAMHLTNNFSNTSNISLPVEQQHGKYKVSVDSVITTIPKVLWDDFSDRGSEITSNTETD
eukprot:UN07422